MAALWRELRRGASTTVVRDRMFGTGDEAIEPGHMDVLDLLHREEPRRMNDLAAALRVDPSTVTRAIQRMEADGLVRRVAGRRRRARHRRQPPPRRAAGVARTSTPAASPSSST